MTLPRSTVTLALSLMLAAVACSGGGADPTPAPAGEGGAGSTFAAEVASTDLAAGRQERFEIGIFSSTEERGMELLTFGQIDLAFTFLGTDGASAPAEGPSATASYVPAPTTSESDEGPVLSKPGDARGVYEADVRFEQAGVWTASVTADVRGGEPIALDAGFTVKSDPSLPAPGDRALMTENLTVRSKGATPVSIDSRAQSGEPIPDPALHRWTIADALRQERPVLVLFATPVYCTSQFCGPTAEALATLAETYPDKAVYIHVEIWKRLDPQTGEGEFNEAAADWLYRNGDLTEPWLYLIDGDGTIADRWGPLFDVDEVGRALSRLPNMEA